MHRELTSCNASTLPPFRLAYNVYRGYVYIQVCLEVKYSVHGDSHAKCYLRGGTICRTLIRLLSLAKLSLDHST